MSRILLRMLVMLGLLSIGIFVFKFFDLLFDFNRIKEYQNIFGLSYSSFITILAYLYVDDVIEFFKFKKIKTDYTFVYSENLPINTIYEISEKEYIKLSKIFEEKALELANNHYSHIQHYLSSVNVPNSIRSKKIPYLYKKYKKKGVFEIFYLSKVKCSELIPFKTIVESIIEMKYQYFYVKYRVGDNPFKQSYRG